jgi:hypothetical protein
MLTIKMFEFYLDNNVCFGSYIDQVRLFWRKQNFIRFNKKWYKLLWWLSILCNLIINLFAMTILKEGKVNEAID